MYDVTDRVELRCLCHHSIRGKLMRGLLLGMLLLVFGCGQPASSNRGSDSDKPKDGADKPRVDPEVEAAKAKAAKAQAKEIVKAVQIYSVNHNSTFPTDLTVLTQPDEENKNKPYLEPDKLLDPWGKPYQLDTSGPEPVVFTTDPSGKRISSQGP
jgi:hypothetical protein